MKKEALALSLKYSFVTPLTSMVVTKPLGENTEVLHKPKEGETPQAWQPPVAHGQPKSDKGLRRGQVRSRVSIGEQHKCEQNKHNTKSAVSNFSFSTFPMCSINTKKVQHLLVSTATQVKASLFV
ncbi:MAG: hypothetical protein ACRC31_01730 [Cetobacterium sp.]